MSSKPFQFGLRSVFVATAAVAVLIALLHWIISFVIVGAMIWAISAAKSLGERRHN